MTWVIDTERRRLMNPIFPFAAIVGQDKLKRALLLCAVNPSLAGVLIRGDKGTAKVLPRADCVSYWHRSSACRAAHIIARRVNHSRIARCAMQIIPIPSAMRLWRRRRL